MFRLNNIKQNLLIVAIATLLTGCGGGGGSTTSTTETTTDLKVVTVQSSEPIITENSATIEWIQNDYITKLVEYGTTKKYGSELLVKDESTITLYNLQVNTTYHYRIVSEDKNGRKVVSRDATFTTLEQSTEPIVTEPIVTEPAPIEPIVTEPIVTEPIVTEPIVTEPIVTEPIVTEPAPTEPTPEPVVSACTSGPAQQLGQITDSISGSGLADVTVTISGCSTKTDADGYYTLNNIVENDKAIVNFEKEGYILGSTQIQIKELSANNTTSTNYLEYHMYAHDYQWNYDSSGEILSSRIAIDASVAYIDTEGNPYSGTISAELTILDPEEEALLPTFPGIFKGINTNGVMVQFDTYGLISLSLKDSHSNTVNLADGETATLVFKEISALEKPNTLPLWYYDYDQGVWIEEGYAALQEDGTYIGDISHSGTWSLNKPIEEEVGIYRGSIVDENGSPLRDVRLQTIGDNWISSDLSTDENGLFEIEVIPGKSFKLSAYDYKNKYKAIYNSTLAAIASGDVVEE